MDNEVGKGRQVWKKSETRGKTVITLNDTELWRTHSLFEAADTLVGSDGTAWSYLTHHVQDLYRYEPGFS